ncbi:MAG: hypothetical protein IIA05_01020 [Proteobacteria bacterium]|nr:hypothetical protein [Pseudomonadota bacterium]MCH9025681.1 hypothetical protein [Pseudomonadota bacterium]
MNANDGKKPDPIPVLTDVVTDAAATGADSAVAAPPLFDENRLAELQTELASRSFELTDRLLHAAFQEMEASLFEQVANRLRNELPELIDQILRDYLEVSPDPND